MTNELMTGLLCECGHDYACHAPAPHFHCGECDCKRSRVQVADHGGERIAALLTALKQLIWAVDNLPADDVLLNGRLDHALAYARAIAPAVQEDKP